MIAGLLLLLAAQNDKAQANGRDDAWEAGPNGWVAHSRAVYSTTQKTAGMVLHVGDSITHANQYGQWARNGAVKTAEDNAVLSWCMATQTFPASPDATNKNGFYLCAVDVTQRSLTASGGISTAEYLSGTGQFGTAMPARTDTAAAQTTLLNGDPMTTYTNNLHITTVAAAFADAQFAVVMLGTNDLLAGRATSAFLADLGAIIDVLELRRIVVILSTLPPCGLADATAYNAGIRSLAQTRGLPLIDYYAEILARQPGTAWQGTLISGDNIHPTFPNPSADPYSSGGSQATHKTGTNAANDGYLLRGWLTVQKLKEVKLYVADGVNPPAAPSTPPAVAGTQGESDDEPDGKCGLGVARGTPGVGLLLGLLLLIGARRRA